MNVVLRLVQAISFMTLLGVTSDRSLGDILVPCNNTAPAPESDCGPAPVCPGVGNGNDPPCPNYTGNMDRKKGSWSVVSKVGGHTTSEEADCFTEVLCMSDSKTGGCKSNPEAVKAYHKHTKYSVSTQKCDGELGPE